MLVDAYFSDPARAETDKSAESEAFDAHCHDYHRPDLLRHYRLFICRVIMSPLRCLIPCDERRCYVELRYAMLTERARYVTR